MFQQWFIKLFAELMKYSIDKINFPVQSDLHTSSSSSVYVTMEMLSFRNMTENPVRVLQDGVFNGLEGIQIL